MSLLTAAGAIVDRIKINVLTREIRDGRAVWIKRRRPTARATLRVANAFFRLAGNPVRALADHAEWQRWEVACFLLLHGGKYRAFPCGDGAAVGADELPGCSLSQHLHAGTLAPEMLAAAARELRRAHGFPSAAFNAAWSHGDPHSGNFIFEPAENGARLIDFEVMHLRTLPADDRHADDLLIFLQDLMGRIPADRWLPGAREFLGAYDRPEIVSLLAKKLVPPRGLARIWWAVRTTYLSPRELTRRLAELRASLSAD